MKNKKGVAQLTLIITLIASMLTILTITGYIDIASIVGYESVYKANWGHICCEEGAFEPSFIRYTDDVKIYKCDAYTDECHITITNTYSGILSRGSGKYEVCNVGGDSCLTYTYNNEDNPYYFTIPYGKQVEFLAYSWATDNRPYHKYEAKYRRFDIIGEENGKIFVSSSCRLDSDLKRRVESDGLTELSKTGINRCQNYITDFILVDTKLYDYLGRDVICQARNIYEVDTIRFLDGSTKRMQGDRIKAVDCCPTETNCDDDFTFKPTITRECTYDYECANGGEPIAITGTSYITFGCSDGKCVQSSPVNVDCTNNAVCVDIHNNPSMVCKNFKCEEDTEWLGHCGDAVCESVIGETPTSCPQDCGDWIKPSINYAFWIAVFLLVVMILLFWRQILAIFRAILGKIGL